MYSDAYKGVGLLLSGLAIALLVLAPFGLWKLGEIAYWIIVRILNG